MNTLFKRRYVLGRVDRAWMQAMRMPNRMASTMREELDYHCMTLMGGEL